jgi:hypothetical protein
MLDTFGSSRETVIFISELAFSVAVGRNELIVTIPRV